MKPNPIFASATLTAFAFTALFISLALMLSAPAEAQLGTNPSGQIAVLNPSYDGNLSVGDNDGYDNYGTVTVTDESFSSNSFSGLVSDGIDTQTTVTGGVFDNNSVDGLIVAQGTSTISGGSFDGNGFIGFYNNQGTTTITGGTFDDNQYYGLQTEEGTATISGGTFDDNTDYGLYNIYATTTITGGDFQNNVESDLINLSGVIDIYGTSFSTGFGDLPTDPYNGATGSFVWDLTDGTSETLTYDNYGTIDLIQAPTITPEPGSAVPILLGTVALVMLVARARRKCSTPTQ